MYLKSYEKGSRILINLFEIYTFPTLVLIYPPLVTYLNH